MAEIEEITGEVLLQYKPGDKTNLIPALQDVQSKFGYLPKEAMLEVSRYLRVPPSAIFGVSTFYALFKFVPSGKRVVKVCRGTACHVRGSLGLVEELQKKLGINPGETTEDLKYSLEAVNCFGACALAPVVVVNETVYGKVTPAKINEILGDNKSPEAEG